MHNKTIQLCKNNEVTPFKKIDELLNDIEKFQVGDKIKIGHTYYKIILRLYDYDCSALVIYIEETNW